MLPFIGTADIGYFPGDRIVGLSKLARVLEHFSHQPQVQERLTTQVSHWLRDQLGANGVGVVIEAEHLLHDPARRAHTRDDHRHLESARFAAR